MCSSLPASGTSALDPSVGACLLTSPEVTLRAVTHSAPAPTCPCVPAPAQSPPSLWQGEGTGQPVLGARGLSRLWAPGFGPCLVDGQLPWLQFPPRRPVMRLRSHTHGPGKETINVCNEVPTPPLLWGFCLINLWSSSPSHPQACPAGRERARRQGETEAGSRTAAAPGPCCSPWPPLVSRPRSPPTGLWLLQAGDVPPGST